MGRFWPDDINIEDTHSPLEILQQAQSEWATNGKGVLELVLQGSESDGGHDLITVYAKHVPSRRTASLFTVAHRPDNPYPVAISPSNDDLPNFLKKTYVKTDYTHFYPQSSSAKAVVEKVTNEWVADTPEEFRAKLEKAFGLGSVKSMVLNLTARHDEYGDIPDDADDSFEKPVKDEDSD